MTTDDVHPMDAPAPVAIRPTEPVVDPQPGSELNLLALIRQVCQGSPDTETYRLVDAVVAHLSPDDMETALVQALAFVCRQYAVHTPRERPQPSVPRPEPVPAPAPGPARKWAAAEVLSVLPERIEAKVNIGSVRAPEWKALGDCTAADLIEAIEIRRDLARSNAAMADWLVVVLDEVTATGVKTVRGLLRLRRAG